MGNKELYGVLIGAFLGWLVNWLYRDSLLDWRLPIIVIIFMFVGLIIGSELNNNQIRTNEK